jgi:hypothetical protein
VAHHQGGQKKFLSERYKARKENSQVTCQTLEDYLSHKMRFWDSKCHYSTLAPAGQAPGQTSEYLFMKLLDNALRMASDFLAAAPLTW